MIDDWSGEWQTATICKTIWNGLLDLQRRGGMVFTPPADAHYHKESDFFIRFKGEAKATKAREKTPLTSKQATSMFQRMAGL